MSELRNSTSSGIKQNYGFHSWGNLLSSLRLELSLVALLISVYPLIHSLLLYTLFCHSVCKRKGPCFTPFPNHTWSNWDQTAEHRLEQRIRTCQQPLQWHRVVSKQHERTITIRIDSPEPQSIKREDYKILYSFALQRDTSGLITSPFQIIILVINYDGPWSFCSGYFDMFRESTFPMYSNPLLKPTYQHN